MSLTTASAAGPARCLEDQLVIRSATGPIRPVARRFSAAPKQDIAQLHERVQKFQRKIRRLVAEGRLTQARREAKTLFYSPYAVLVAASRAIKAEKWPPGRDKPSPAQVAVLMMDRNVSDPVSVTAEKKASGGHRAIFSFELIDCARQHLLRIAYEPLIQYAEQQYGVAGASLMQAAHDARQLIASGRYKFAAHLDIKNCFGSVDLHRVQETYGIPQWVLDEIITTKGKEQRGQIIPINRYTHRNWHHITQQQGYVLPQGSLVSPMLAYGCMREMLERFSARFENRVVVMMYCDNLLLLAPGQESLQAAESYLIDMFTAENFTLKNLSGSRRLSDGITFIGHKLQRRANRPYVDLTDERARSFSQELGEKLNEINRPSGRMICAQADRFDNLTGWLKGTIGSMAAAPDAQLAAIGLIYRRTRVHRHTPQIRGLYAWLLRKIPTENALEANRVRTQKVRVARWREPWNRGPVRNPDVGSIREHAAQFCSKLLRGELGWLSAIRLRPAAS